VNFINTNDFFVKKRTRVSFFQSLNDSKIPRNPWENIQKYWIGFVFCKTRLYKRVIAKWVITYTHARKQKPINTQGLPHRTFVRSVLVSHKCQHAFCMIIYTSSCGIVFLRLTTTWFSSRQKLWSSCCYDLIKLKKQDTNLQFWMNVAADH